MKLEETWAEQEQVLRHTLGNVEEKVYIHTHRETSSASQHHWLST